MRIPSAAPASCPSGPSRPRGLLAAAGRCAAALALGLGLGLGPAASPAHAGEEDDAAVAKKLKEQVEKILRLMKENEDALLEASAGGKAEPKKPEIDLPVPPEGASPKPPEGSSGGGSSGSREPKGAEIVRGLRELVEAQRQGARKIPLEIEELIRMIPERGGGGGSGKDKQMKPGETPKPEDQEARDARRRLEEQERMRREQEERERQGGKDPHDPRDPKDPASRDPDEEPGSAASRNVPAWMTGLPPEIRDAFANGDYGSVPPAYRDLVRRYVQWLSRQAPAGGSR